MWVQLRVPQRIDRNGEWKNYAVGSWVEVGEQKAKRWLAAGIAWIPPQRVTELLSNDCGMVILGAAPEQIVSQLSENGKLGITQGTEPDLPYPCTCIWDPGVPLKPELLPVGFALLDTWQVACPLWDYRELACHEPDEAEKEKTKAIVRDLRIPMYDTRLMWVRRCGDTRRLIDAWIAEGKGRWGFLRALYQVKPLMLSLPITWAGKRGPERG